MSFQTTTRHIPRRSVLCASLAISLGISLSAAAVPATVEATLAAVDAPSSEPVNKFASASARQRSSTDSQGPHPTTPHTVSTCADDDSPGSLRAIIASPNTASGDTIDLTQLPMGCSTITLDSATHIPGHITINQASLTLIGPGSGQLTIEGNLQSGVLRHNGYQTLDIEGLTIANGKYSSASLTKGGCLYSKGSVTLKNAHVDNCWVQGSGSGDAWGGGAYVKHDLTLDHSTIANGYAQGAGPMTAAFGGGVLVQGDLNASYSTISDNRAIGHNHGAGGGAGVFGNSNIESSTISGNRADVDAGLLLNSGTLVDSTISGNEARGVGGVYAFGNLSVTSSTIAFNVSHGVQYSYGGIYAKGATLVVVSSIMADNTGYDLWAQPVTTVSGSNNLIMSSHGVPPLSLTVSACPKLDVLADNGGATLTHALSPDSPAKDAGDAGALIFDQTGNLRTVGIAADIGAFEWRGTPTERIFTSRFENACDD